MSIPPVRRNLIGPHLCGLLFTLIVGVGLVSGEVVTFEGFSFPEIEDDSWQHVPFCQPQRWVQDGWLFQHVDFDCDPPPDGDMDRYQRSLADFVGEQQFFLEWRMRTDGNSSEIPGVAPAFLGAADFFGILYHFTIARDQVRFIRDNFDVIVFVDITPDHPHTYRLELYGADEYFVYIDGEVINSGVPGGAFPNDDSAVMAWRALAWQLPNTTQWDYIRLGTIPQVGSGDFDSDGEVNFDDWPYFEECFSDLDAGSWPGCRWADFDFDTDVDCVDGLAFLDAWTDPADPPELPECDIPADLDGDGQVRVPDLIILLSAWGPCPEPCEPGDPQQTCPADLDGDCQVRVSDLIILLASWG